MSNDKKDKERLTVDLDPEEKRKLRIITAMSGEKHMQKMVIRLINEKFENMNVKGLPNFNDEEMKNLRA